VRVVTLPATGTPYSTALLSINGILLQGDCVLANGLPDGGVTVGNFTGSDIQVSSAPNGTVYTIFDHQGLALLQQGQTTFTAIGTQGALTAIVMLALVPGVGCRFSVAN
jgi:hypothetical protein